MVQFIFTGHIVPNFTSTNSYGLLSTFTDTLDRMLYDVSKKISMELLVQSQDQQYFGDICPEVLKRHNAGF